MTWQYRHLYYDHLLLSSYQFHHHYYRFYSLFNILWFFLCIEFIQSIDRSELSELHMYDPMKCRSGNYRGKVNIAIDGTECLDWIEHKSFYKPYWSDDEARKHKNYCRNPGNDSSGPWCVVGIGRFKYCDVPRCAEQIGCYDGNGADYSGDQDQTSDGHPCAKWRFSNSRKDSPVYRYRLQYNNITSRLLTTTDSELDNFRSCRNPGGIKSQPWCYPIKVRGVSSSIQYCDIPKCSDPGTLGYPIFINGSQCMPNFIPQKQLVKLESSAVVEVHYCVAPHGFIYQRHHNTNHYKFKQFCLFLVGKTTYCPAGFIRTRRFQPSLEFIGHVSGPTAWRPTFDNILQIITCCVQPEFWTNSTQTPHISIEKVSQYKTDYNVNINVGNSGKDIPDLRNIDSSVTPYSTEDEDWIYSKPRRRITVGDFFPLRRRKWITRWKRSVFDNYLNVNISEVTNPDLSPSSSSSTTSIYTSDSSSLTQSTFSDPPLFVSIHQCPPVKGTNRLVAPLFRNVVPDETLGDVLQNLFPEISCEYREAKTEFLPNAETKTSQIAILINEPTCPSGFVKTQISRRVVFILGTSISLCWSVNRIKSDMISVRKQLPIGNYCLVTDHSLDGTKSNYMQETDKDKRYNYKCPQGLRQNEINFVQVGYRLKLCCSINSPTNMTDIEDETTLDKTNYQAPLGITSPFAVIQNGPTCPTFYSGNMKLTVVQYNRPIPRPYCDQIELSGPDNPVKLDGIPNIVICQYLNQEVKLGVKSLRYDCDGLGHREVMSYGGATCGFEANSSVIFPPGKYCFLQLSSTCPTGFTSRSGVDRFGFSLQSLGSTCCRTEESIGAIKLPINLKAPFKLPAVYQPCQAIENFNVDAELHQCVYYPKGNKSQIMFVWPRVISNLNNTAEGNDSNKTSVPKYCSKLPGKRVGFRRSQLGRLSALFFNIMQDQWLTYKRPRWTTRSSDSGDICFNELNLENLPTLVNGQTGYCIPVFGSCPHK
ncbi:Tissue-type plasminogen activator, partial [Schistosoma japonicum]